MEAFRGRRVVVSGAAGFVGSNLTEALLGEGAEVHALVRPSSDLWRLLHLLPRMTLHCLELTDRDQLRTVLREIAPSVIFHGAVSRGEQSEEQRWQTLQTNVMATAHLLEVVLEQERARLVHLGGSLEATPPSRPLRESDPLAPRSYYGATKAAATLLCREYARLGAAVVVLRPVVVYGPWESPHRLVPAAIRAALTGSELPLTAPGIRRDWVYVGDLVEACLRAACSREALGELVHIGSGRSWANEEVVASVEAAVGRPVQVRVGACPPRPWDQENWVADIAKARAILGWEPRHDLRAGLARTVAWHSRPAGA